MILSSWFNAFSMLTGWPVRHQYTCFGAVYVVLHAHEAHLNQHIVYHIEIECIIA